MQTIRITVAVSLHDAVALVMLSQLVIECHHAIGETDRLGRSACLLRWRYLKNAWYAHKHDLQRCLKR